MMQAKSLHDAAQVLSDRLATGWAMCEQERDPNRKSELERHWLALLREYEQACDERSDRDRRAA